MQVVADTNIVVAALLKKGDTRHILFSRQFEIFSPDRIIFEVLAHKEEFKQKGSMEEKEFQQAFELELENITIVPIEEYASFKEKALSLCPKGHEDDWPFLALALKTNCAIWSQDNGLKKQSTITIYSTAELLNELKPCKKEGMQK